MSSKTYSPAALALDIMSIAESPRFAFQVRLAHETGLLTLLLADQQEAVERMAAELLSQLSADQSGLRQQAQAVLDALSCRHAKAPQTGANASIETGELSLVRS